MRKIKQTERPYTIRYDGRLYDSARTLSDAIERIKMRGERGEVYHKGQLVYCSQQQSS